MLADARKILFATAGQLEWDAEMRTGSAKTLL
jgi:hypothetical protein